MSDVGQDQVARRGVPWVRVVILLVLGAGLVALHQDLWNWKAVRPLVFGFLPIGLAYQAGYSVACALFMWLLVGLAWPKHLECVSGEK